MKTRLITAKELPANCWIRGKSGTAWLLVVAVYDDGRIQVADKYPMTIADLAKQGAEWSSAPGWRSQGFEVFDA